MDNYDLVNCSDLLPFSSDRWIIYSAKNLKLDRAALGVKSRSDDLIIYEKSASGISDFSVARQHSYGDDYIHLLWCENEIYTLDKSVYYAWITAEMAIINQARLPFSPALVVRGGIINGCLVVCRIDRQSGKLVVSVHDISSPQVVIDEVELTESLQQNYFSEQQHILANITLSPGGANRFFLAFLLASGTLRVYQLELLAADNKLSLIRLFDFAFSTIGYHQMLFDEANSELVVVYSENKPVGQHNNICIARQKIFNIEEGWREDSVQVNQSPGYYLKPALALAQGNYFISWQGEGVFYSLLDHDFNFISAETCLAADAPGNIVLFPQQNISLACQVSNVASQEMGREIAFFDL